MKTVKVVVVADGIPSHDYLLRGFNAMLESLKRFGHEPLILGWGKRWTGLGSKPRHLKRAIEDGAIKTSHILFADAYDVWFSKSPEEILDAAGKIDGQRILWNAEKTCFPDASLAEQFKDISTSFRYLNSGASIGDVEAYYECLLDMNVDSWADDYRKDDGNWVHRNDQDDWMRKFLHGQCEGQAPMKLDTKCSIFQTLTGMSPDNFEFGETIVNKETGESPMVFHANGGSKTSGVMEPILKHLGL